MSTFNKKAHWEGIYTSKPLNKVSWYQPTPETSLSLIAQFNLPKDAAIIDIGAGDSFLVDHLLELGYSNLTVLDISEAAIKRAQERLGKLATSVNWVVSDVTEFRSNQSFDLWHDRAAFHFLTEEPQINSYKRVAHASLKTGAGLVVGTFSDSGPTKCSGIEITRYSDQDMINRFLPPFDPISCINVNHETPFDTVQNFTFCCFKKKA